MFLPMEPPMTAPSLTFKWFPTDELLFFEQILRHNGTKYAVFSKKLPGKSVKSLNNKWQLEKRRVRRSGMFFDWKSVLVVVIERFVLAAGQLPSQSRREVRRKLLQLVQTLYMCDFSGFDRHRHQEFACRLYGHIEELLGPDYFRRLGIHESTLLRTDELPPDAWAAAHS
ncbi:hypothetical protein GMRT_11280 [Giardia muris]|uniref:Myb-like domain-containing protein n=1 Tax=Giardia muris TaxID=5742 RepID=A0A4Z1SNN4_GIAMU|nr:hypothetical protein GMRT_11280 [Giardia muris]|eukprot:TNJ27404.1 hypothetical protein GMRT_11280 [Giardia muris]